MIFDEGKENDLLVDAISPGIVAAYKDAASAGYDEIQRTKAYQRKDDDVVGVFDLTDPEAIAFIQQHSLDAAKYITGTTREYIQNILSNAYEAGTPIREIANQISSQFEGYSQGRSLTIARTEMGNAVNAGTFEGYKQAGADKKSWLASPDERTRESHWRTGMLEPIPLNEAFPVGASLMMYPNDPAGEAKEVINCRCALVAEVSEE